MLPSEEMVMGINSQESQPLHNYVFADLSTIFTSIIIGIVACKMVYELSQLISAVCFKGYSNLSKSRQIEWDNRAMSTFHAVYITAVAFYFTFWSDLYSDDALRGPITLRRSSFSTLGLGVSVGYFLSDLGMIVWYFPTLGGMEYVIHHLLSSGGAAYAMLTGEAQAYAYTILISEATTPSINLRWYLDAAGRKNSKAYIVNGIVMFVTWLVARILLFIYFFYHVYRHYEQIKAMHRFAVILVVVVPAVLSVMNLIWFWKICRGLKKTLAKRE